MRVLIVGASLAGLRTAEALRASGSDAAICMVGSEPHAPYDRTPLSKELLTGDREPHEVALRTPEQLADLELDLRLGTAATSLDLAGHGVGFDDGSRLTADVIVLATGSRSRSLAGTAGYDNVFGLRSLEDAAAIRAAMTTATSLVVVGSGFIGSEVASAGRARGLDVTVIESASAPLARVFGAELGSKLGGFHEQAGSSLLCGRTVVSFKEAGSSRVDGVLLDDGTEVAGDLFVIGVGSVPNAEWLSSSGLDVTDGVRCTASGQAVGAEHVYAVGDVARWWSPRYGEAVRTEHWTAAGEQAAVVAAVIQGRTPSDDLLPYVWSDQFGHRVQIVGRPRASDDLALLRDVEEGLAAITGHDGVLSSAVVVDQPRLFARLRRMVRDRTPWKTAVADSGGLVRARP
ncbi:FAD-dependent oxidoreductase [Streptomyces sp. NPDC047043]|uniref:NAD(P)/FAD-dependent oxidoreductase n=1 Tax=Streptomyces sp. NPDC047043 TaxID=3154497 RepID=UPI0033C2B84E